MNENIADCGGKTAVILPTSSIRRVWLLAGTLTAKSPTLRGLLVGKVTAGGGGVATNDWCINDIAHSRRFKQVNLPCSGHENGSECQYFEKRCKNGCFMETDMLKLLENVTEIIFAISTLQFQRSAKPLTSYNFYFIF